METLHAVFIAPWLDMWTSPLFFAEVVISGLLTGVMYSLVALGFVLIFKASGTFNFAQGVMVLFAALLSNASCCVRWSIRNTSFFSWPLSDWPSFWKDSES
jgi:branched-subunit amino acid ABC-type transport system permease component